MKIFSDTKIYVLCPANVHTGGPESLHQLTSRLISFGVDAKILYCARVGEFFDINDPVHPALKKYHVPYTFGFEDSSRNVFVVPEPLTEHLYAVKKCRKILWWMSVNNYLENILELIRPCIDSPLTEPVPKYFTFDKPNDVDEHWGQSEFVRQFLRLNGVKKIRSVETHMGQIFLSNAASVDFAAKKNFVTFNPRKGFEFTKKLIELAPDIDWRPIENMSPVQVRELLAASKVYIDFGNFPGRERLPREAAVSGCVVIIGKRGAAGNDVDFNIPAEFKFDEREPEVIIKKIRDVLKNFDTAFEAQKNFREQIFNAQKNFSDAVIDAFGIKKFPPPTVALTQGVDEKSFLLAEEFFRTKNFLPKFIVDDTLANARITDDLIVRDRNRNYLRVGKNLVEIISFADAKFLYLEGRIQKFALLEPTTADLDALKNFAAPDDVLTFTR
ncbi:MAG: hypothetical protein IJ685_05160 [Selenomonadaceae bacterium]|nr:hypothetical protein [Selenomonadaceae bacterium]